jgi:hypothetical protein
MAMIDPEPGQTDRDFVDRVKQRRRERGEIAPAKADGVSASGVDGA